MLCPRVASLFGQKGVRTLLKKSPDSISPWKLRASVTMFGFITAMKVNEIVADQFGHGYLEQKVAWGAWPE
jgi:hypothetical protein